MTDERATPKELADRLLGILRDGGEPAKGQADARAMIDAATTYLRETEALPDPQRPPEETVAEMVSYLERMPEDQGYQLTRAMIAAAGMYLSTHFGETVAIDTVRAIMGHFVVAEILKRHEASTAGLH